MDDVQSVEAAQQLVAKWSANPHELHKRPPFKACSFDTNDRFWVVGSTRVSVLHGRTGDKRWASEIAHFLNEASASLGFQPFAAEGTANG